MEKKLVLITYNVRPGVSEKEYSDFTKEVDYPIFRQNPNILDYRNFIVRREGRGKEWFQRFDLMYVNDLDRFYADGALHFGDQTILEHAQRWREIWGHPLDAGSDATVNITLAEEI